MSVPSARRKVVTVLFCDVVGSTSLGESVDPEALRDLLARYFEQMKSIVERHGGSVEKFIGDAVMAVFGVPAVHEDDALRACRAALEMRAAFDGLGVEGRIGIDTGEVVTGTEERLATGDAVNVAARLQQAAASGEVLVGEATFDFVRDAVDAEPLEPLELKGKSEPVRAYALRSVREAVERRHEAGFVGREREVGLLRDAWERARLEQRCEAVTIVAEAGVGKTRLVDEALAGIAARVVRGHCLPYGDGITYWPVTEAALQLADVEVEERVRRPLGAVLGAELQTTPQEIAWAFRKLVEAAAPVAVVFDDVHWGEEAFLDLIEHVALLAARAPILLVCMARPELLDRRPSWPVALRLEPLPQGQVERMIGGRVPDETQTRIVRAAGGNPLFVQELLAMMEADDAEIAVPPNLQALLAARLDQLDPSERRVLEHGSVEGELFHLGAVATLTPEDQNVTGRLASLVRRALVQPDRAQIPDEDGFRFRHLLVRDAAYDSLPKSTRADLHERFSDWLERHGAGLVELDEILGYHLEQAFRFRESLGSPDEALAGRAARHLATAGRRAFARGDMPATINLLERAVALPAGGGGDHRPVGELGDALAQVGELERARELLGEAVEHARVADDPVAMWTSRLTLAWVEENMDATDAPVELEREARAAIAALEDSGDDAALAKAWRLLGEAYNARCQGALWQAALEQAVEHAGRTTDVVEQYLDLWLLGGSMFFGPAPVDQAGARLESLARDFPDPVAQVGILRGLGAVRVQQGRFDEARKLIAEAKETLLDRGLLVGGIGFISGPLEALAGDLAAAEEELRESMASLAALRWTSRGAALAMLLARVLARQHRDGEAEELMEEWSAVTGAMYWLEWDVVRPAIKATILARRGEVEEAERLAREAVAVSVRTDFLNWRADVHLDLAEVLRAAGKSDEARASVEQAVALFEQKGNVVSAGAARALLG